MYTISLGGKGGSNNNLRIDGGLYGSICLHNLLDNSYIKNATVMQTGQGNALYIDSWKDRNAYNFPIENSVIDGRYWAEGDGNVIVGKNSSFGIIYLRGDGSGGAYAELTDCTYTSVDFTGNKGTGRLTVYTSPDCENAGTKTVYDINNTAGIADESYAAPALGHKLDETNITGVIYESYLAKGIYTSNCAVCNAENVREETGTAPALFACLGYSAQSYGDGGILVGFGINSKAISEYTDITGKDFKFGLFAGRDTKLGENDAVNINGEALSGIASIDYTERDFDIVEIKVVGFVTVDHKNANLALGLFVINGESISYIQPTKPNDGEKYSYVSYNGLIDG